ncbi:hypothetical protein [Hymenobacter sediminicola]|uniref:Uncharacterized protein n=1 Tax=Hymenobacter sediminicola TaxID=2761579 RepID=A0A7G7W8Z2_9BACT|nr:hypothetical protein [Hymenobacter sediminicola]QNH62835.1 hypothetical protein H4317_03170 [Hymenobacter sediminicola]
MYRISLRLLSAFVLLLSLSQLTTACVQRYTYMQVFYYGSKTVVGPILRFSPAFKGKAEIEMVPDEYTKMLSPIAFFSASSGTTTTTVTTSEGTFVDGQLQTAAQLEQQHKQEAAEHKAQMASITAMMNRHVAATTQQLSDALNSTAEEGWEVTQMASLENGGLVYLLRKKK